MRNKQLQFTHRIAKVSDVSAITGLMKLAIEENMKHFLSSAEIETVKKSMGLDMTLIEDGTYFLIESVSGGVTHLVGCGGWGKRKTLYGGDHTTGRNDEFCDPRVDSARIRAMYTHPDWTRQGVGSLLIALGEEAAQDAGFRSIELGATVAGEPLYLAHGYVEYARDRHETDDGTDSVVIKMRKDLGDV